MEADDPGLRLNPSGSSRVRTALDRESGCRFLGNLRSNCSGEGESNLRPE